MVADRSVTVRLKIDNSDFLRGLAEASAAAKAFDKSLGKGARAFGDDLDHTSESADDFSSSTSKASKSTKDFDTSATKAARSTSRLGSAFRKADGDNQSFIRGLNTGNDRMSFLVQTSLALGPALIPALAALVPATAGFATALGFAATAAGVGILAFQGVGDALKALNDAQIDPTAAHLEKLRQVMDTLGPAGKNFVVFLQDMREPLQQLQNVAQANLFPGLQEGIEQASTQLPLLEKVIAAVASAMGEISASAGEAFTSPFWTDFFRFIKDDAQAILVDFASAIGHLIEGFSAMIQAFGPLSADFVSGFDNMARSFSEWAQGLSESASFQEFLDFVREAAPEAQDVLVALVDALVALADAGAGVGLASLEVLQRLLEGLAGVLSSPIGPPLLAIAAGISAVSRAVALYNIVAGNALFASLGKTGLGGSLTKFPISRFGAIAGGVTLLAASFTDLDESLGVENAVTFGALGAFFGPLGAAAGVAAGGIKDAAAANNDMTDSIENANQALRDSPTAWQAQADAIKAAQEQFEEFKKQIEGEDRGSTFSSSLSNRLGAVKDSFTNIFDGTVKNQLEDLFGDSDIEEGAAGIEKLVTATDALHASQASLASDLSGKDLFPVASDMDEIISILNAAQPALDHLGVSQERLIELQQSGNPFDSLALTGLIGAIGLYNSAADSQVGKTRGVLDAIGSMDSVMSSAADSANALATAMDSLLSPNLDLVAATDEYTSGLRHLNDELAKHDKTLVGDTDAAIKNRAALTGLTDLMTAQLTAEAAAGATSKEFVRSLQDQRQKFIAAAEAAGLHTAQIKDFLKQAGLTPHLIKVAFEAVGIDLAKNDLKDLVERYNNLPKNVRTDIKANGVDADATVKSLLEKYKGLSKEEVKTILEADDQASHKIDTVELKMSQLDGDTATVRLLAQDAASAAIRALETLLHGVDGDTATVTVNTNRTTSNSGVKGRPSADGGQILGPGGPRSDLIPAMLSNGEFVVNAFAAKANLDLLHQINARKFADGGPVRMANGGQPGRRFSPADLSQRAINSDLPAVIGELTDALREMRAEAKDVTEAEKDVKAAREASRQAAHALNQVEDTTSKKYRERAKASREADKDLEKAEKELSKQRDQLQKATDAWKEKQAELLAQAKAVQDAVLASGAIFGGEGTSITVGGMLAKLKEAAKDGREFNRNIAEIRAAGLDERLVQQLLDNAGTPEAQAAAENLANASKKQINALNAAEGQLLNVAGRSGRAAVGGPGNDTVNIKFTGDITTTDVKKLPKALEARMRRAVRIARQR